MAVSTYIEPLNGDLYGFPKKLPDDQKGRIREWLIEQGYSKEFIDAHGHNFHYRCWEQEDGSENRLNFRMERLG